MPREEGAIGIRVVPDTSTFRRELFSALRRDVSGAAAKVPVETDREKLKSSLAAGVAEAVGTAERGAQPVRVRTALNSEEARRAVSEAVRNISRDASVRVRTDVDQSSVYRARTTVQQELLAGATSKLRTEVDRESLRGAAARIKAIVAAARIEAKIVPRVDTGRVRLTAADLGIRGDLTASVGRSFKELWASFDTSAARSSLRAHELFKALEAQGYRTSRAFKIQAGVATPRLTAKPADMGAINALYDRSLGGLVQRLNGFFSSYETSARAHLSATGRYAVDSLGPFTNKIREIASAAKLAFGVMAGEAKKFNPLREHGTVDTDIGEKSFLTHLRESDAALARFVTRAARVGPRLKSSLGSAFSSAKGLRIDEALNSEFMRAARLTAGKMPEIARTAFSPTAWRNEGRILKAAISEVMLGSRAPGGPAPTMFQSLNREVVKLGSLPATIRRHGASFNNAFRSAYRTTGVKLKLPGFDPTAVRDLEASTRGVFSRLRSGIANGARTMLSGIGSKLHLPGFNTQKLDESHRRTTGVLSRIASTFRGFRLPRLAIGNPFGGMSLWAAGITTLITAVVAALPVLLSLGKELVSVAGLAAAGPAAFAAMGVGALVMGMALKDAKKQLGGLAESWKSVQASVSSAFWGEAAQPIKELAAKHLPAVKAGLTAIGGTLGSLAAGGLKSFVGSMDIGVVLGGINSSFAALGPGLRATASAFGSVIQAGMPGLLKISGLLSDVGVKVSGVVSGAAASGQVGRMIDGGIESLKTLAAFLGQVVLVVYNVARAIQTVPLAAFTDGLRQLNVILAGTVAQSGIAAFFNNLTSTIGNLGPAFLGLAQIAGAALGSLGGNLPAFAAGISAVVTTVSGPLSFVLSSLGTQVIAPLLAALTPLGPILANAFASVIPLVAPLGSLLASVASAVMTALGPIASTVLPALAAALVPLVNMFAQFAVTLGQQLAPVFASLAPLMQPLVELITQVLALVLPLVPAILQIVGALVGALAPIVAALVPIFASLVPLIQPLLDIIVGLVNGLLPPLVSLLVPIIQALGQIVMMLLPPLLTILQGLMPLVPAITQIVAALVPVVLSILPVIMRVIQALMPLINLLAAVIPPIILALMPMVAGTAQSIIGAVSAAVNMVLGVLRNLISSIMQIFQGIVQIATGMFQLLHGIFTGNGREIANAFSNIMSGLKNTVAGIFNGIVGTIREILGGLWNVASNAAQGFINGFANAWGGVRGALERMFGDVGRIAKEILGIHSPSRVLFEIGVNTGRGAELGVDSTIGSVQAAAGRLGRAMIPEQQDLAASVAAGAQRFYTATVASGQRGFPDKATLTLHAYGRTFEEVVDVGVEQQLDARDRGYQNEGLFV